MPYHRQCYRVKVSRNQCINLHRRVLFLRSNFVTVFINNDKHFSLNLNYLEQNFNKFWSTIIIFTMMSETCPSLYTVFRVIACNLLSLFSLIFYSYSPYYSRYFLILSVFREDRQQRTTDNRLPEQSSYLPRFFQKVSSD